MSANIVNPHIRNVSFLLKPFEDPETSVVQGIPFAVYITNPYWRYLVDNKRMFPASVESAENGVAIVKLNADGILAVVNIRGSHRGHFELLESDGMLQVD